MFKNGIIIGSFQPFHNGHKELIEYALTQVETVHIFFHDKDEKVGINKFWSTSENLHQIRELFDDRLNRFTFNSISKPKYNEKAWIEKLGSIFKVIESPIIFTADEDATVVYLKHEYNIPYFKYNSPVDMSSERLRKAFLNNVPRKEIAEYLPPAILDSLDAIVNNTNTNRLDKLLADDKFAKDYAESAKKYTPFFVTADVILIHHNRVLLVTRGKNPGLGLRAFPGGFVDHNERTYDAALRELTEETCINIPVLDLKKRFVKTKTYDDPKRSLRGRVITHAYLFDVSDIPLDTIKFNAADDAAEVYWYDIRDMNAEMMFEDHADILWDMLW